MERFRGKLVRGDQTIADDIVGVIHRHDGPGLKSWEGSFTLPASIPAVALGEYELVLDDGRSGMILISSGHYSSHQPATISFKGNGAWP